MRFIATFGLLLAFPISTFALQGKDCLAQGERVAAEKRDATIAACLQRASSSANAKAEDRKQLTARCEQNAKNKKLQGSKRTDYISSCVNKDEAAVAKKRKPENDISLYAELLPGADSPAQPVRKTSAKKRTEKPKAE